MNLLMVNGLGLIHTPISIQSTLLDYDYGLATKISEDTPSMSFPLKLILCMLAARGLYWRCYMKYVVCNN